MIATRLAAETLRLLPRKRLSRALGRVASTHPPRDVLEGAIAAYVRAYDVDLSECEIPAGGFGTFNEFFTRGLRPGARPLDPDPDALLSPADGRLEDAGTIDQGARFLVKGREYEVGELLGEERDAARYVGGTFAIVYLSPRDYHRVHAPVTGEVTAVRHVPGTLYPVNRIGVEHVPRLFARNERVVVTQASETHGEVTTILVGAVGVGSIALAFEPRVRSNVGKREAALVGAKALVQGTLRYTAPRPRLARGDELGRFLLGSTAIVLTGPTPALRLVAAPGDRARVGRTLATKVRTGTQADGEKAR